MAATDVRLRQLLKDIIDSEGVYSDDQDKVSFSAGSEAGDGFVGINRSITIKNAKRVLNLFAKTAPKNEALRKQLLVKDLFTREIHFYRTVYPEFVKFQAERGVREPFDAVSKCYATSTEDFNEVLVFDDLRAQGYVLYDKEIHMSKAHVELVFKSYAQFHAVSYAMRDQEPTRYAKLTENLDELLTDLFKRSGMNVAIMRYSKDAQNLFDPVDEPVVARRIENLTEIVMAAAERTYEFVDDYSVITHGDCWCNNFMFKYKDVADETTLQNVKILDWQIMRVNSPVLDLCHFLYTTASREIMADLDFYLKTYHQTLSNSIKKMGSDPEKLYPYSVFTDQWKRFSRYGLMASLIVVKVMLGDKEEVPKTVEMVDAGKPLADAFQCEIKKSEIYNERIRNIIEHFVQNEFI